MSQIKVRKNFIIALPKDLQDETLIKEGDIVEVKVDEPGRIIISNIEETDEEICPVLASRGIWQDEIIALIMSTKYAKNGNPGKNP